MFSFVPWIGLIGCSLALPPHASKERIAELRSPFGSMISDPVFLAEAATSHIDMEPIEAAVVERARSDLMSTSTGVADELRVLLGEQLRHLSTRLGA